jgi:hypothetical protein
VAKSPNATAAQRVEEVLTLRLAGAAFVEIRQYASENGWGVGDRQLWHYIHKSDELLAASLETDRKKLLALHLAQRRLLHNRTMETGDYRTALAVLRDSAQLQDLYPSGNREPLDTLLNALPPEVAAPIRAELARQLSGSGTAAGGPGRPDDIS